MRTLLMLLFCPEFLRRIPQNTPGQYLAEAGTVSFCGHRWMRVSVPVSGRRAAYLRARWEALKLDWFGSTSPESTIVWCVRSVGSAQNAE